MQAAIREFLAPQQCTVKRAEVPGGHHLGHRAADDKYASAIKVRFPLDQVVERR